MRGGTSDNTVTKSLSLPFRMPSVSRGNVFARDRRVAVVNIEHNPGGFATAAGSSGGPGWWLISLGATGSRCGQLT
jgi:hypothetical protein